MVRLRTNRFFQCAYGVSEHKIVTCNRPVHGNSTPNESALKITLIAWLGIYFDFTADYMPNKDIRILPMHTEWKEVYNTYVLEMTSLKKDYVSAPYFYHIRKIHFSNVHRAPFTCLGKCQKCIDYHNINFKKLKFIEIEEFRRLHKLHIEVITIQRAGYEKRKLLAQTKPDEYLSIIIDHTNSLFVPTFYPVPKRLAMSTEKISIHMCGLIDHGSNERYFYHYLEHWPQNANIIITIIHHFLQIKLSCGKFIPPRLMLQVICNSSAQNY